MDRDVRVPPYRLDQCDEDTIASALLAPQTSYGGVDKYASLAAKAGALLYALAKSQACPDGNKRVALILLLEFLALNGMTLDVGEDELAELILETAAAAAADREAIVEQLGEKMEALMVPLTPEDV